MLSLPLIARALPFLIYVLLIPVRAVLAEQFPIQDLRWLYGLQVALVALALATFWRGYGELRDVARPTPRWLVAALVFGVLVFVLWVNLDLPLVSFEAGEGFDPRGPDGRVIAWIALLRIAGAALVVPVMEELFWRSLVMRWIDRPEFLSLAPGAASLRAVAISSLVFGFEHSLWFAGILAGLVYAELYRRSGNLWVAVVSHGVTNLLLGVWIVYSGAWSFW